MERVWSQLAPGKQVGELATGIAGPIFSADQLFLSTAIAPAMASGTSSLFPSRFLTLVLSWADHAPLATPGVHAHRPQ
jgi:hypothetical protein